MTLVLSAALRIGAAMPEPASASGLKQTEQNDGTVLSGNRENHWGEMLFQAAPTPDMEIKGTVRILKPAKLFSPPTPYWALNYHYLNEEPGYDFGIMVRLANTGSFYRFQFSTKWNEVALWKEGEPETAADEPGTPSGFFAAVKTGANIRLNRDYAFTVRAIGNRLELSVNGAVLLSYEDNVLPLTNNGWGVSVFNEAEVQLTGLQALQGTGEIAAAVRNRPDFRVAKWHHGRSEATVIFDGDEPIASQAHGSAAWLTDVKFKPGYRAQVAWPFLFDNKFRTSMWKSLKVVDDTVVGTIVPSVKSAGAFKGGAEFTLRYDRATDSYSYDVASRTTFKRDDSELQVISRNSIYFANLYTYNPMPTTDPSVKVNYLDWSTASSPYRAALVKLTDGKVYRWPVHHFYSSFVNPGYPGGSFWQSWNEKMKLDKQTFFIMYQDKVSCPTLEMISAGEDGGDYELVLDSCCQFWDMHFWYRPLRDGKPVTEFKAGQTFHQKYRIFGLPAVDADRLAKDSQLLPNLDPAAERPYYVNGVNRFDQGGNVENTPGKLIWHGGAWDKGVGRGDNFSLRFDGNGSSNVFLGYNGSTAAAQKIRVSLWVKSEKPWNGPGVRLGVEGRGRFGGSDRLFSDYVVPNEREWTQLVYDFPYPTYQEVSLTIFSQGGGKVWIDDLEYQIIEEKK